jgi:hypothetical protein
MAMVSRKRLAPLTIDHVFVCTSPGARAADRLLPIGILEGSPNTHPGQGTACRRFFFRNAMLEFLWVENPAEAQSRQTRQTRLWERWPGARSSASPFGIILRPEAGATVHCPFPSWEYWPPTMPGLFLRIAAATTLQEPMWCYMENGRAREDAPPEKRQPLTHPAGLERLTRVTIVSPPLSIQSVTQAMANQGVISLLDEPEHRMELEFDHQRASAQLDLRPELPLICRW